MKTRKVQVTTKAGQGFGQYLRLRKIDRYPDNRNDFDPTGMMSLNHASNEQQMYWVQNGYIREGFYFDVHVNSVREVVYEYGLVFSKKGLKTERVQFARAMTKDHLEAMFRDAIGKNGMDEASIKKILLEFRDNFKEFPDEYTILPCESDTILEINQDGKLKMIHFY